MIDRSASLFKGPPSLLTMPWSRIDGFLRELLLSRWSGNSGEGQRWRRGVPGARGLARGGGDEMRGRRAAEPWGPGTFSMLSHGPSRLDAVSLARPAWGSARVFPDKERAVLSRAAGTGRFASAEVSRGRSDAATSAPRTPCGPRGRSRAGPRPPSPARGRRGTAGSMRLATPPAAVAPHSPH